MSEIGPVGAVLLAGGQARRMGGGDKCLLTLGGRTLLERVIERLRPQVAAMVVNANGDPRRFAATHLPVVADSIEGSAGPLAGVLAGLDWACAARPEVTHVASIATDTPFFPKTLVAGLVDSLGRTPAVIACAASRGRVHPVFGLWPVALAEELRAALGQGTRKVDEWTARYGVAVAHFDDPDGDLFFNINTPDDLETAARRIARAAR